MKKISVEYIPIWLIRLSRRSKVKRQKDLADIARVAKYNQLLRIEAELGDTAKRAGWDALRV